MMRVFISWSGERSRAVAAALREWLPCVVQAVLPWMSENDIEAGADWSEALNAEVNAADFGIICVTPENREAPWLLFEAGALAKKLEKKTYVCPYLLDMTDTDIKGPLARFQAKEATHDGTRGLVLSMYRALEKGILSDQQKHRIFDKFWPDLEAKLASIKRPELRIERSERDMLSETLGLVRTLVHHVAIQPRVTVPPGGLLGFPRKRPALSSGIDPLGNPRAGTERLDEEFDLWRRSIAPTIAEAQSSISGEEDRDLTLPDSAGRP